MWAGAAMSGDPDAIAALESIAERLAPRDPAVLVARHPRAYIAIGQTRAGQLERATTSHLRALEIVRAAGLLGDLPTYQ
ncbi:MAG: hypothetical protein R3E66_03465 [bacterium]